MRSIDQGPDIPGTLPAPLEAVSRVDEAGDIELLVRLLDGQVIRGTLSHEDQLMPHGDLLPIRFFSSELKIPLRDIRTVEMQAPLADTHAGSTGNPADHPAALPNRFHLVFVDDVSWNGQTLGHRRKNGGLQLYVQQPAGSYKSVWIPDRALKTVKLEPLPAPPSRQRPAVPPAAAGADGGMAGWAPARAMDELTRLIAASHRLPIKTLAQAILELRLAGMEQLEALQRDMPDALHGQTELLIRSGLLSRDQLEHVRARMACIPEVDALNFRIEPQAFDRIPLKMARDHDVLPLGFVDGTLCVASACPMNHELEQQLRVLASCSVIQVWAGKPQIQQRLFHQLHPSAAPTAQEGTSASAAAAGNDIYALLDAALTDYKVQGLEERDVSADESSSFVRLVTRMIMDAYYQKASDIHIETNPGEEFLRIRFRKDGDLEDYLRIPGFLRASLVSRIKVMSRLDISEKRRPQDGKINFHDYAPVRLELRVAILPTHDGLEDVVMRLLASSAPMPLQKLGLSGRDDALIKKLAERSFGLLLACGPTGSGKTTTLHSILAHINTDNRKIWTAEDPIEITHPGLRQLHVNPKIGVTFASAMRAFLRADPDVIMIGEIRDEETAGIAVEASLTGHLVMSTLHTNSAAESIVRLLDMGMDPMNFADSLVGIVAQRLVRSLCPHCATPRKLNAAEIEALMLEYIEGSELPRDTGWARILAAAGVSDPDLLLVKQAAGCDHCRGTGYKGRTGIYEVLENTPSIKHLIQVRASTSEILADALRHDMRSLRQDALEKVVQGKIDLKHARTAYT